MAAQNWCVQVILTMIISQALSSTVPLIASSLHQRHTEPQGSIHPAEGIRHVVEQLTPSFPSKYRSRRVKVSYPAVEVPPMMKNDGMADFHELSTFLPCTNCLILEMSSDIEYEDHTGADPNTGMWLHHAVFVNRGRKDTFCGERSWGQRFYAVGNEKTTVDMSTHGDYIGGYHIAEGDEVAVSVDLMNMGHNSQKIVFTTTYEYVPVLPESHAFVEPLWLDIGGCETSDKPAEENSVFSFSSPSWKSDLAGRVVFAGGHLHDGGTKLQLFKNEDLVCETHPTYRDFSFIHVHDESEHILNISSCSDFAETKPGDEWAIKAYYDTSIHAPMKRMDGSLEPVMGISLVYIARESNSKQTPTKHCSWWRRSNIIPLAICVGLVAALVAFWGHQNRRFWREGQIRLVSKPIGRLPWWVNQELKLPVLSYRSNP